MSIRRGAFVGLTVAVLLAAAGLLWLLAGSPPAQSVSSPAAPAVADAAPLGVAPQASALPGPSTATSPASDRAVSAAGWQADLADAGLTPDDIEQLRADVARHPQPEAEVRRVVAFLAFQRRWERFQQLQADGAAPAQQQALARQLEGELISRWQRSELSGAQTLQAKAVLLQTLLPNDEAAQRQALQQWRTTHRLP